MDMKEGHFEHLYNMYIKHQEQFQTAFHIVTALGIGWLAAGCTLISVGRDGNLKWITCFILLCAFINISLELVGIIHFLCKIEKEKKQLIRLFDSIYPNEKNEIYYEFFSMPYPIIYISIGLIAIECLIFILLGVYCFR